MSETKFKVGDRVRCTESHDGNTHIVGKTGTVRTTNSSSYGVEFDEKINGHDLYGDCKDGCGWFIPETKLERLKTDSRNIIVIHPGDPETTAEHRRGSKVLETSTARVSADDTYDEFGGAIVALAKLYGFKDTEALLKAIRPGFKSGDKARVIGDHNCNCARYGDIITLRVCVKPGKTDDSGRKYDLWSAMEDCALYRDYDLAPVKADKKADKYDAMSNHDLYAAACFVGSCSASVCPARKRDCPFYNIAVDCPGYLDKHPEFRQTVIDYLRAEDGVAPEPAEHYYTGKVVCVGNGSSTHYTVGKIYEFRDGLLYNGDRNIKLVHTCNGDLSPVKNFMDWMIRSYARWLEVKE